MALLALGSAALVLALMALALLGVGTWMLPEVDWLVLPPFTLLLMSRRLEAETCDLLFSRL